MPPEVVMVSNFLQTNQTLDADTPLGVGSKGLVVENQQKTEYCVLSLPILLLSTVMRPIEKAPNKCLYRLEPNILGETLCATKRVFSLFILRQHDC